MNLVEVKTSELIGPALDWAVGIAEGWEPDRPQDGQLRKTWRGCTQYAAVGKDAPCFPGHRYSPSTDWSQGGPLIEQYDISIIKEDRTDECAAYIDLYVYYEQWDYASTGVGPTPLIAAMRCLCADKLGDTVQVPAELLTQNP